MTQQNSLTAFHKETVLKLSSVLEGDFYKQATFNKLLI
jgi:hypothetical protein